MNAARRSRLRDRHPRRWDVPGLALAALVLLAVGVYSPALTFDNLFDDQSFSVLTGIGSFFASGNLLLGTLLLAFSVLFPATKLIAILLIWFQPLSSRRRQRFVEWLELLGKWSLLDAFVIAVLVGTVQLGILSEASAESGIYLYLAAILLSLVATFLVRPLTGAPRVHEHHLHRAGLWLTLPAATLYGIGLSLPLLQIEKGWFWESEFSLLAGTHRMFAAGEYALAAALLLFVIAIPAVRFAGLAILRTLPQHNSPAVHALRTLDRWSMLDVFALALLVVVARLGTLASVEPRAGMWCLFAAALLSTADSLLLQRTSPATRGTSATAASMPPT